MRYSKQAYSKGLNPARIQVREVTMDVDQFRVACKAYWKLKQRNLFGASTEFEQSAATR